jgi:hypothetical protein
MVVELKSYSCTRIPVKNSEKTASLDADYKPGKSNW